MNHDIVVTNRDIKCIDEAIRQASQSPCCQKHGCVIFGSGKIIGKGFNNHRTFSGDKLLSNCFTCHAEIAAIRQCLHKRVVHRKKK